jgi:hypothetical protein
MYVKMQKIEKVMPSVDNYKMVLRDTIKSKLEKLVQGFKSKFEDEIPRIEEGCSGLLESQTILAKFKNAMKNIKKTDLNEEASKKWHELIWEIKKSFAKVSANITNNIC